MILYRPVSLQELAMIYDSGMKAFPARLPQQPIFYPVLDVEYARQTAAGWNVKSGQHAGYVTQFKVEDKYIERFETHTVGASGHEEFWIPAEEIEEFNRHIVGHIKVVEAHFGKGFEGFIPEKFALQGKNAVEQFTVLANTYMYKRMDFYLEIKRNHKAVFLNYPFWQANEFKNPGLKEKLLQAIKEAWLASFPQVPLPNPIPQDAAPIGQPAARAGSPAGPAREKSRSDEQTGTGEDSLDDLEEERPPVKQPPRFSPVKALQRDRTTLRPGKPGPYVHPGEGESSPASQSDAGNPVNPIEAEAPSPEPSISYLVQGVRLGLEGKHREATALLFKAVDEDPDNVVAQTSLGVAFHQLGEDDRALACYETALKVDPIYAEAHYFRANLLYERGNVPEAMAGYTVALGLKPELIEAHRKPAPQDRLTDYTGAPAEIYRIAKSARRILELSDLVESSPGQADLFRERGAEYYKLRNYAQAIADYTSFLAIQPDHAGVLHARGLAYEGLGQAGHAKEDYERALRLNSQLSDDYINRGIAFAQNSNYRQAILTLSNAIRLAPRDPNGYFNRGIAYFQQADFESAIADFSMVIQLASSDEEAYYWRGFANEAAGRQSEAAADYRQFLVRSQNPQAKKEIEQKLRQWNEEKRKASNSQRVASDSEQRVPQVAARSPGRERDLHSLIVALGERALDSTWYGRSVECYGERAEELHALTDGNMPIEGADFLSITSGILQTIRGDFQAFDPGADSPWIWIRAWEGDGFYAETDDPEIKVRLQSRFESVEQVSGATPPYEGVFVRI